MAGLIAALFGGRSRPPDPNPLPGIGGVTLPPGPAGQTGFPGSTSATRTWGTNASPRSAKLDKDALGGVNNTLGNGLDVTQHAYRGDVPGADVAGPRSTGMVGTRQTTVRELRQHHSTAEFYGGPMLHTGPGNNTAGANPLGPARRAGGHSKRDTETPPVQRQPVIGAGTPGANNVRNQVAQRYHAVPGLPHNYRSAPNPGKPADEVVVPSRGRYPASGGNWTWSVQREMPYGGRGDGARGADLNGQRYYATGQGDAFWNGAQGDYGIARQRGGKRPVGFTEPGPWTANFYDTTEEVGSTVSPGAGGQAPQSVYVSPITGRASNSTGRTG